MSIWTHEDRFPNARLTVPPGGDCRFCPATTESELRVLTATLGSAGPWQIDTKVLLCDRCGWHCAWQTRDGTAGPKQVTSTSTYGAAASLRTFDQLDDLAPLADLRDHLMLKGDALLDVTPRQLEHLVGDIFGDLGWESVVTAASNDGGVDVFLRRGEERVGIEVKRYRSKPVSVGLVRQLAGAMVANDLTTGMFVTTSRFTGPAASYAREVADEPRLMPVRIDLIDGVQLLQRLELAQRSRYAELVEVPTAIADHLELIDTAILDHGLMSSGPADPWLSS